MTHSYSYIIIDDEPKAIKLLSRIIQQYYSNLQETGTYISWELALDALKKDEADLIFLDISMPHKNGMALLEMASDISGEIIFVTAHEEHALKAYKYAPSGYILKPIVDDVLKATIDKAIERIRDKKRAAQQQIEKIAGSNKIAISNKNGLDYVNIDEILFFEADARYTKVITTGKNYTSSYNLGKFKAMLEKHSFYPVHRSYMVNLNRVSRYERSGILIMENGDEIPVAKNARDGFLSLFERL